MTPEEAKPFITVMAEKCIPHGLSCLVTEDRSKELAAVRLFGVAGREDDAEGRCYFSTTWNSYCYTVDSYSCV